MHIGNRAIGNGHPVYIIAEMSANHGQSFERAVEILKAAKESGADAVKLQTYTPETMTIDCDNDHFQIQGTMWAGRNLFDLYGEAFTPWEWQPKLGEVAGDLGMDLFSTPFDISAVDFLAEMNVPAYKIASFENVDLPLLERVGRTGKPVIMSTGMATLGELEEAVSTLKASGTEELILLKCTSAYPASGENANLRTIPHLSQTFGVPAGVSDHSMGLVVPVAAVTLGACVVEKHFTLSRDEPGPDSGFSLEPHEFRAMVDAVRATEKALGEVRYGASEEEQPSTVFRRSLFIVQDLSAGDVLSPTNVRSIRPGIGLHTRHLPDVIGRVAVKDIARGTPLSWDLIGGSR